MSDDTNAPVESPLPPAILRGLGDRAYDKRKTAAGDVTILIKTCLDHNEKDRIVNMINLLASEFTRSRNVHLRKGGLIGLAAAAIGLANEVDKYLYILMPPVIECFDDPENRVCYYACEALYNISKVARTHILRYFNQIFEGLCKLFSHVDVGVKNGANLLDRLIKDIVTEAETFDIELFIPLLQKHIKRTKPYIRQLLVSWITVLDAVPDLNMLDYLPEFLEGLFNMLSDSNREIKQAAENCLSEFLREIKEAEIVEFGPMVTILVQQCRSKEKTNRFTSIFWLQEFILLGGTKLLEFYAAMLSSVMYCISDVDADINVAAINTNQNLLNLVRTTKDVIDLNPLLNILTIELSSYHIGTRMAALQWILMLYEKDAEEMCKSIHDLLPVLLKTISDSSDEVVVMNLHVLAKISLNEIQFQRIFHSLVQLFQRDRSLLETRGALVIRKLSSLLEPRDVYMSLADILNQLDDLEFISLMVQTLNLILLTANELDPLRKSLKAVSMLPSSNNNNVNKHIQLFSSLFRCWVHNPVATFSLCLLAQAYDLSACLIHKFADINITVGFLMQIDKLVQLLESPIFINLRLQLLETNSKQQDDLLKSLYGLLMLLPQSQAYKTLSDRLTTVSALRVHIRHDNHCYDNVDANANMNDVSSLSKLIHFVDFQELLARFEQVQEMHTNFRLKLMQQQSIVLKKENA